MPDRGRLAPLGSLPSARTPTLALRTRRAAAAHLPRGPRTRCWSRRSCSARLWSRSSTTRILGGGERLDRNTRVEQLGAEQRRTKFLVPEQSLLEQLANRPTFILDNIPRDEQGWDDHQDVLPRPAQRVPRQQTHLLLSRAGRLVPHLHPGHVEPEPAPGTCRTWRLHLQLSLWSAAQPAGSNENDKIACQVPSSPTSRQPAPSQAPTVCNLPHQRQAANAWRMISPILNLYDYTAGKFLISTWSGHAHGVAKVRSGQCPMEVPRHQGGRGPLWRLRKLRGSDQTWQPFWEPALMPRQLGRHQRSFTRTECLISRPRGSSP